MSHAKHRQQSTRERHPFRTWLLASIGLLIGLGLFAACAAMPTKAAEQPKPFVATEWHDMAVPDLQYACDPVLGVIVQHRWYQLGGGDGSKYDNWTISVTPYSQLNAGQRDQMCGGRR